MSNFVFAPPAGVQWPVRKRPLWNTRVQESVGGMETRVAFQSLPRWRWSLGFEFLRYSSGEWQYLAQFYNDRRGRFDSWLYTDPTDSTVADIDFGVGDGSTTTFQLGRKLSDTDHVSVGIFEPIYNLNGAPVIRKGGVVQATPADYSVSATGLVTFTSAPAAPLALSWSGSYYWRCRFDQDLADFDNFMSGLWALGELSFISIQGS